MANTYDNYDYNYPAPNRTTLRVDGTNPPTNEPNSQNGVDQATLRLGYQVGKEILQQSKFVDYFSLSFLKPYFAINNRYVLYKIKTVLLPFLYRSSANEIIDDASKDISKEKIEYPDLYIPLMSFITYILLIAFNNSYQGGKDFNPEILGIKSSKNFFIIILYSIILKVVLFVFCNVSLPFLDLLAYASYKFVLVVINLILWIVFANRIAYYTMLVYTLFMSMILMQKVLSSRLQQERDVKVLQKMIIYVISLLEILTILLIMLDF